MYKLVSCLFMTKPKFYDYKINIRRFNQLELIRCLQDRKVWPWNLRLRVIQASGTREPFGLQATPGASSLQCGRGLHPVVVPTPTLSLYIAVHYWDFPRWSKHLTLTSLSGTAFSHQDHFFPRTITFSPSRRLEHLDHHSGILHTYLNINWFAVKTLTSLHRHHQNLLSFTFFTTTRCLFTHSSAVSPSPYYSAHLLLTQNGQIQAGRSKQEKNYRYENVLVWDQTCSLR